MAQLLSHLRAPSNRTAGLAAAVLASTPPPRPRLPLAALSSVASQPGWLPPPPCQGLPGSPLRVVPEARRRTESAPHCWALSPDQLIRQPARIQGGTGRLQRREAALAEQVGALVVAGV